jgi:hypothetical protein
MVKYWRGNGIKIVIFLDDGLGTNSTYDLTKRDVQFVESSLIETGFVINIEKSILDPVQHIEWKGLLWNSIDFKLAIRERRIQDLKETLGFLGRSKISAGLLAICAGKIISMMPLVGNVSR